MNRKVEIDLDTYINILERRRDEVKPRGWTIPDGVWDYYIRFIEECGVSGNADPAYVVDNLAVNGDYGRGVIIFYR